MKLRRENGKVFCMFFFLNDFGSEFFLLNFFLIGLFQDILFETMMMDTQH